MSYEFSTNQWNERYIEEINNHDFINMKSDEFFEKILDFSLSDENTLFIILGSDSGLLLPWLAKKTLGRGSKIVVIEHDNVYPIINTSYRGTLSSDTKNASRHNKISLVSHTQWQEGLPQSIDSSYLFAGKISVVESHASCTDYSSLYLPVYKSITKRTQEIVNQASFHVNRSEFTKMQFENAVDSNHPLKRSINFGLDKTAIVLGGGPSVDLHIDWVIKNRDKLFILAVSRLTTKLLGNDIIPDALVAVDPQDVLYEMCKQAVLWTNVPLLYNYHVSPLLLQQWQGPAFYLGKRLPWHGEKELEGCVASAGPTVGHAAVFVASQLGFSSILMSGIDFCYTESLATHTAESPEHYIERMPNFCSNTVETYTGRMAATNEQMFQGALAMEDLGKLINRHAPILFNLNDEAAQCKSIPYKSIDEVVLNEIKPELVNHTGKFEYSPTLQQIETLESELKVAKYTFKKMRTLCQSAKSHIKEILGSSRQLESDSNSIKLTKVRKQLDNKNSKFLEAIVYANAFAFKEKELPTDFSDMSQEELLTWGKNYYTLVEKGCQQMSDLIDSVAPKIQLRRDEINPEINIRDIAKRWREDGTLGRILRWKTAHALQITGPDKAWVQRTIGKYRSTLNESNQELHSKIKYSYKSLQTMVRAIEFYKNNSKLTELKAIEPRIAHTDWPYCALHPYVCGLIDDLQGNIVEAVSRYQQTVDICSNRLSTNPESLHEMQRLIEECLVKMTHGYMTLSDPKSALTTLGLLCEMLPTYVVSYAKMLNLVGEQKYAIELLESYVELYPTNKKASFLLSTLQSDAQEQTPTDDNASPEDNQQYVQSINGAMQAIMG